LRPRERDVFVDSRVRLYQRLLIQIGRDDMSDEKVRKEEYRVRGEDVISKVKEVVHEGNVRRVIIKNEEGRTLVEVPLTIGVVGALLVPSLAALGAIAALVTNCTIVVEKVEE
jgi:hypothetical protein